VIFGIKINHLAALITTFCTLKKKTKKKDIIVLVAWSSLVASACEREDWSRQT
jgi:hypothetical protein